MKSVLISVFVLLWVVSHGAGHAAGPADPVMVDVKNINDAKNWTRTQTTLLAHLQGFAPAPVVLGKYGGRTDRKEKATGFFYTKQSDGGWVFVDPEGNHYFSIGVCSISPQNEAVDHKEAFAKTFSDSTDWAKKTHAMLVGNLRFNSLGCWSDWKTFKAARTDAPYVLRWNMMASFARKKSVAREEYGHTGFKDDILPVFDKEFADHCDEVCREMAETREDPWLIGHFSDNELPFTSKDILKRYLKAPPKDESHIAATLFLKKNGITEGAIASEHDIEFTGLVLRTYYKTVHDAIRKHDPNHLILGSRLHGKTSNQDICYTASGPFVDVVSINYYHRWTPVQDELNRRAELAMKPILITEFYAKSADSGLNNSKGAGFTVPTQKDRGRFYENFSIGLLKNRNVVGWHWFRYIDDGDLKTKDFSSNKGIVNVQYQEYRELSTSMQAINSAVYQLSDFLRVPLVNASRKKHNGSNKPYAGHSRWQ